MRLTLSPKQIRDLKERSGQPVLLIDEETQRQYVLLPVEKYERLCAFADSASLDIRDTYPAQNAAAASAGWDDPTLDAYNDYDSHRGT